MNSFNLNLIKELRLRTGIGISECKRALIESYGNIDKAIIILRKNGKVQAEKKKYNTAIKGVIVTYVHDDIGFIIELNCETDFVAQHSEFISFAKDMLHHAFLQNIQDYKTLKNTFEENRIMLISKFNENIIIRRFNFLKGNIILSYLHGFKIGVLLQAQCKNLKVLKKIAMHIAASRPEYIHSHEIPKSILDKEKSIQLEIAVNSGKSSKIAEKIVHGRINKFISSISLLEQDFIIFPQMKVKDFLNKYDAKIFNFIRFELGEVIK